jgi:hypothetical protein
MQPIFLGLLVTACLLCGCADRRQTPQTVLRLGPRLLFVATNGNDAWSGRLAWPNREGSDGPFATISHAFIAARALRADSSASPTNVPSVLVRGGTYFLNDPLVLRPEDSNLRVAAAAGEHPVISGGRRISRWKEVTIGVRKYWAAEIPEARDGKWFFHELWVKGERRTRARHPNKGYLKIVSLPDKAADWTKGHTRFEFWGGDLKAWPSVTNGEVVAMTRWVESRLPVVSVEETQRLVNLGKRSVFELQPEDLYYVEHVFELLDAPGEWYLDTAAGTLFYLPLPGEQVDRFEAIAPVLPQVVRIEGHPENQAFINHVEFRGLTFAHTEWNLAKPGDTNAPPGWPARTSEVGGFSQAAVGVPAAVWGEGAHNCRFVACKFVNLGTYGLELGRGCRSNQVVRCEFGDLGAGGVRLGETDIRANASEQSGDNEVADCNIHHGGRVFQSAIGIWIGQSPNNHLTHNLIHDFYYTGISVGWTWGYGPALAAGNLIEWNHVHHIGVQSDGDGPVLSDMAGIYTLGMQPGTRIVNNLWHDMAATKYGGWGIYTDEGSSGILIASNIVYRTTHGGFHQHYGAANIVRNNIFAWSRDQQLQRSREEPHVSFSFSNNIVLFDKGVLLGSTWKNDNFVLDSNLYWDMRLVANPNEIKFAGATLEQWRARGHDQHSLIADPMFLSPTQDDFRFKPNSPALKVGFLPFDLSRVGPRP